MRGLRGPPGDSAACCCWSLRTRDCCAHVGAVVWAGQAGLSLSAALASFRSQSNSAPTTPCSSPLLGHWGCGEKTKHLSNLSQALAPVTSQCFLCNILFNPFLQLVSCVLQIGFYYWQKFWLRKVRSRGLDVSLACALSNPHSTSDTSILCPKKPLGATHTKRLPAWQGPAWPPTLPHPAGSLAHVNFPPEHWTLYK